MTYPHWFSSHLHPGCTHTEQPATYHVQDILVVVPYLHIFVGNPVRQILLRQMTQTAIDVYKKRIVGKQCMSRRTN